MFITLLDLVNTDGQTRAEKRSANGTREWEEKWFLKRKKTENEEKVFPFWWGRTEIWNWAAGGWRESDVGWWRGCEDGKGKLRRGMSDGARRSKWRRRDESEKGKTAGKICSNELSCLQIYVVLWLSLCMNQRRWGDSSNATPKRERAFICVCIAVHFYSPSARCPCLLQSKLTSEFDRTLACGEVTSTNIHTTLFQSLST